MRIPRFLAALALSLPVALLSAEPNCAECAKGTFAVSVETAARKTSVTVVSEADEYYSARLATIRVGDTVKWTNIGQEIHTTTSNNGLWDSGLMKPGQSFSHTFKSAGSFNYSCTVHQNMLGKVVVLPLAPVITSALSATGAVGASFHYEIIATNAPTDFTADPLPPGITFSDNTFSGTPTEAGTFIINLSATNAGGSDSKALTLQIIPTILEPDQDGDGFPDALENATASDPTDASSTPYGIPAQVAQPLNVTALQIALNFAEPGHDRIALTAMLPIDAGTSFAGKILALDVGGVVQVFSLDANGFSKTSFGKAALTLKAGGAATLVVQMKGTFAAQLAAEGLTGTQSVSKVPVALPLNVLVNGTQFSTVRLLTYSAKANKTGVGK